MASPDMIEHAIEHDAHAARMDFSDERAQFCACAVVRTDIEIIGGVVFVIGVREMNRIQIKHIGVNRLQVIELASHAGKIAAPEINLVAPHACFVHEVTLLGRFIPLAHTPRFGVVRAFRCKVRARREAIDEDLIDHRTRAPIGFASSNAVGVIN